MPDDNQAQGNQQETVVKSTLEGAVNEIWDGMNSAVKLAGAAIMPFALAKAFPEATLDIYPWVGANIAGDATTNYRKGKKTHDGGNP